MIGAVIGAIGAAKAASAAKNMGNQIGGIKKNISEHKKDQEKSNAYRKKLLSGKIKNTTEGNVRDYNKLTRKGKGVRKSVMKGLGLTQKDIKPITPPKPKKPATKTI